MICGGRLSMTDIDQPTSTSLRLLYFTTGGLINTLNMCRANAARTVYERPERHERVGFYAERMCLSSRAVCR